LESFRARRLFLEIVSDRDFMNECSES